MNSRGIALAAVACAAGPVRFSFGEIVFRAWIDAPQAAVAGSTFGASVWVQALGSSIDSDANALASFTTDVLASGLVAELSEAELLIPGFSVGTPDGGALREVSGFNHPAIAPFSAANPLELFTINVTLVSSATGTLVLDLNQTQGWEFMFSWWLDYDVGTYAFDTDPGSTRIVTPALVRVVPEPASIGLLACAALAARRRR
ncbi:MAG: hypothetical protein Kow0022_06120 [Phycisphaerales bacterium]